MQNNYRCNRLILFSVSIVSITEVDQYVSTMKKDIVYLRRHVVCTSIYLSIIENSKLLFCF